jgi:DeoR family glycerol-3-phosphate regulon repressor
MTELSARQQHIVHAARDKGFVTIDELVDALDVTQQTIRRDINFLCEQGVLSRFHGGATFRSSVENLPYEARIGAMAEEKAAIAARVAEEIPDHSSVFIDIGTTAEAVAYALRSRVGLRIVTNNLNVVRMLADKDDFEVTIVGGVVRGRDMAITGPSATAFVERFRLDFSILGVVAIDRDGSILDFFIDEEPLTKAIIRCGRQCFVVADSSKFGRQAMAWVAHLSQISAIFTDAVPTDGWAKTVTDTGARLEFAPVK